VLYTCLQHATHVKTEIFTIIGSSTSEYQANARNILRKTVQNKWKADNEKIPCKSAKNTLIIMIIIIIIIIATTRTIDMSLHEHWKSGELILFL